MQGWKKHSRSCVMELVCVMMLVLLGPILAPHLREVGLRPPASALADYAEFTVDPGGAATVVINGAARPLPPNFTLVFEHYPHTVGGLEYFSLSSRDTWQQHWWAEGAVPIGTFTGWTGFAAPFPSFQYPNLMIETLDSTQVIDGFPLNTLQGAPVQVIRPPPDAVVRIGFLMGDFNRDRVTSVGDIFDFLACYFGADARADVDRSGSASEQDIYVFLTAYFAGT